MSNGPGRCRCFLCRRHRRARYIADVLRRAGDEPSADWIDVMFDHLCDVETTVEMFEHD